MPNFRTHLLLAGAVVLVVAGGTVYVAMRPAPVAVSGDAGVPAAAGLQAAAASPSPSRTAGPGASPRPSSGAWPGPGNTGVPAGWVPVSTRATDLRITTRGAVVTDIRLVGANLVVEAENVTVQRVELQGGSVLNDAGPGCRNGLVLEDVSIVRAAGRPTGEKDLPGVQAGGYTARRVKIDGRPEGFRVGGRGAGCGPVTIVDSFARVRSPDTCTDWHGDGIQGYDGPALTARNVTLDLVETAGCSGTAAFFYPGGQSNASATVDRMLVKGGGYPFRLTTAGSVRGLRVVDGSWGYGPVEVRCAQLSAWEAAIVTVDANYQPTRTVRTLACS